MTGKPGQSALSAVEQPIFGQAPRLERLIPHPGERPPSVLRQRTVNKPHAALTRVFRLSNTLGFSIVVIDIPDEFIFGRKLVNFES